MAIPKSAELLRTLRQFKYHRQHDLGAVWPSGRRSAVLVLLFIGSQGELRVLLTKRSRSLRSFSGHVSFPGGKADSDAESFEDVARREAEEEIGLPRSPELLASRFQMGVENVCMDIPCYISRTLLSVKPVVCFLHNHVGASPESIYESPLDLSGFFGKLNPGETSSIFSIPLMDLAPPPPLPLQMSKAHTAPVATYKPEFIKEESHLGDWGGLQWDIRHVYYPATNPHEPQWLDEVENLSSDEEFGDLGAARDVWGLTAKILTDIAKVARGVVPSETASRDPGDPGYLHFNHERLIYGLHHYGGEMQAGGRSAWEKRLINNNPRAQYSDRIPAFYMDYLRHSSPF